MRLVYEKQEDCMGRLRVVRNPRVQDVAVGDLLPVGQWRGHRVVDVFHGHYPHVGNYVRFTIERFEREIEVEYRWGRSWKPAV